MKVIPLHYKLIGGSLIAGGLFALGRWGFKTPNNETGNDAGKDVVKGNLSYPLSWYSQTADTLQQNLLQSWKTELPFYGDDIIKAIISSIAMLKNRDDWNQLVYKFGDRTGAGVSIVFPAEPLTSWLVYFLDDKEFVEVNALKIVRSHLSKFQVTI